MLSRCIRFPLGKKAWNLTFKQVSAAIIPLCAGVGLVQLILNTDNNPQSYDSMLRMMATFFANISGESYTFVAPCIGVLGAFFSGSNTVSNILFAPLQYEAASLVGLKTQVIMALQNVGGAAGNMICINNIVAVCAISAMLLPGISGSTILLIFGIYQLVLTNIKALITDFNFQSFGFLSVFGLGVLFGAFFISKIISNAFKNHRSKVLYFIMGLLIGSIYAIYNSAPLIKGVDGNNFAPFTLDNLNIIALILGIFAIIGIEIVKNLLNGKKD